MRESHFLSLHSQKKRLQTKKLSGYLNEMLSDRLKEIENNMPRLKALKSGEAEPVRCENCDYCTSTRKLIGAISIYDLQERI